MISYSYSSEELQRAYDSWGCNCGPGALAIALQTTPDAVRPFIPGFDAKRYTSPTMMKAALNALVTAAGWESIPLPAKGAADHPLLFDESPALVRIQFTGPWTAPGMNPRWAYGHTHWVCCWQDVHTETHERLPWVFDVNGGITTFRFWRLQVLPEIIKGIKRADGDWYATHCWRLKIAPKVAA